MFGIVVRVCSLCVRLLFECIRVFLQVRDVVLLWIRKVEYCPVVVWWRRVFCFRVYEAPLGGRRTGQKYLCLMSGTECDLDQQVR